MKPRSLTVFLCAYAYLARGQDTITPLSARYTFHFQETTVSQYRPPFAAPYSGEHSQVPEKQWATTITSTIFAGVKLWKHAQLFINPEIAGGHGLSSAYGIAAFTNGEAFRVGNPDPTIYMSRLFMRQLIPLNKERLWQNDDDNKIAQYIPKKYIAFTLGKISVSDYFDDNTYSHNPRNQFLSWGLMSNGAWDYAANTRGYTPSAVIEFIGPRFEARYAMSLMPVTANGNVMEKDITKANANVLEAKLKYQLMGRPGKISAIAFYNNANMGSYTAQNILKVDDTLHPGQTINEYSIMASRQYGRSKYGFGLNMEQELGNNFGMFLRASYNDGKNETWCFTEIDRAISIGGLMNGKNWLRENDYAGVAFCLSGISPEHRQYLSNGGLGFMLGDGKLNYSYEQLYEFFYKFSVIKDQISASAFYQLILNPAYNKDRGPISVLSIRFHFRI